MLIFVSCRECRQADLFPCRSGWILNDIHKDGDMGGSAGFVDTLVMALFDDRGGLPGEYLIWIMACFPVSCFFLGII